MKIFLPLFFLLFSCHGEEEKHSHSFHEVKVEELPQDFKIPSALWDQLVGVPEKLATGEASGGHGSSKEATAPEESKSMKNDTSVVFLSLKVSLTQKNEGVLKGEEIVFDFPRGGGRLDLSHWTTETPGTFYLKFDDSEFSSLKDRHVFFLSRSRKRKLDGEVLGTGCNKFMELGPAFEKAMSGKGLALNTTQNRHLTVAGGRWIFVARETGKLYISQVSLEDSQSGSLFCEEL